MRLVLEETPFLEVRDVAPNAALSPPTQLELYVTPLLALGSSLLPWKKAALQWGLTPEHRVEVISEKDGSSSVEWPVRIAETAISLRGEVTEARITVFYVFMEWGGTVVLRGPADQIARERERAMKLMLSGRPDWMSDDDIVALAQVYADSGARP